LRPLSRSSAIQRRSVTTLDPTTKEIEHVKQTPSNAVDQVRPEGDVVAAGAVSGAPKELLLRPVRIYRPSPTAAQSAKATSHHWRLDWDILQGSGRWENQLMGWASTADTQQAIGLKFKTKDAAIHFCEKQGYPYFVQEPNKPKFVPKNYASNYFYKPGKLRIAHTK